MPEMINSEGKALKRCSYKGHKGTRWQDASLFNKDINYCRSCHKKYKRNLALIKREMFRGLE
jgi:hypothetical protein